MKETNDSAPQNEEREEKKSDFISRACYNHGFFCATHPRLVIFVTGVIILACSAPLLKLPLFGGATTAEWITLSPSELSLADGKGRTMQMLDDKENTIPRWFVGEPLLYVQQFVMAVHINPWRAGVLSNEMLREALKPAFNLSQVITDFTYKSNGREVSLSDVCLSVTSQTPKQARASWTEYLPANSCVVLSPANFWNRDYSRFANDFKILDEVYQSKGRQAVSITLKEFIFGVPLKHTGIYPALKSKETDHTIRYAVTVLLKTHDVSYLEGLKRQLEKLHPLNPEGSSHSHGSDSRDYVVHIYYKGESGSFIEIWHLCLMYFLVFLYLTFSVAKIEMVKSKIGLAFSAVITIMASLTMAAGLCSFFGLVPTLNSSEIFPYLVIVIGVENILVITKSVVSTPFHLNVEIRVAQGLSKEGRYIFKNLVIEMALLVAGHFTYVPAVQEFCLFAVVGLSTDFFLQMVFFATVLSIDMRRLELSDLERISAYQQSLDVAAQPVSCQQPGSPVTPVRPTTPGSPLAVATPVNSSSIGSPAGSSFTIVTSGTQHSRSSTVVAKQFPPSPPQFLKLIPPLPSVFVQQQTPSRCPIPLAARKLPKRLNFAYFFARTRLIQKICMVCAVLYFLYMVYSSVTVLEAEEASNSVKVQMQNASSLTSKEPVDVKPPDTASLKEKLILKGKEERKREHSEEDNIELLAKEAERVKAAEDDPQKTPDPLQWDGSGWYFMGQQKNTVTAEEEWRSLSKRHWPQLLGYYNISLVSRYISVLPPVYLGTHLDTTTILSKYVRQQQSVSDDKETLAGEAAAADTIVEQEQSSEQETTRDKANSDYYLHALYCVILGVVVMIILFFICKFLNDCQIDPKSRFRGRGWSNREDLLESLPLILDGHMQAVEHLECLGSTIVSVCLSGRIWVWEASSGDCRKVMSRNSTQGPPSLRKRKKRESSRARKELTFDSEPGFPAIEWDRYSTTPDIFSDSESSVHQHTPRENVKRLNSRHLTLSAQHGSHAKLCDESITTLGSQKVLSSSSVPAIAKSHHRRRSHGEIQAEQLAEMEERSPCPTGTYRTHTCNRQRSNGNIKYQSVTLEEQRQVNPGKTGREYNTFPEDKNPYTPSTQESCKSHNSHGSHSKMNGEQYTAYGLHVSHDSVRDNIRSHRRQGSDGYHDSIVQMNARHPQNTEGQGVQKSDVTIKDFHTHRRQGSDGYQDSVAQMNARHPQNTEGQGVHKSDVTIKDFHTHRRQSSDGYQDSVAQMNERCPQNTEGQGVHKSDITIKKDFHTHRRQDSDGYQDSVAQMNSRYQHNMEGHGLHKSDLAVKKDFQTHRRQGSGGYQDSAVPTNSRYPQSTGHGAHTSDVPKQQELRTHRKQGSDGYQDLVVPANLRYTQSTQGHRVHTADGTVEEEVRTHRRQGSGGYQHAADLRYTQATDGGKLYVSDIKDEHKTHCRQGLGGQQDSAASMSSRYPQSTEECEMHISNETVRETFRTHRRQGSDERISSGYNSNSNENVAVASSSVEFYSSHHRHKSEGGESHQQRQGADAVVTSTLQLTEDIKKHSGEGAGGTVNKESHTATEEKSITIPRSQSKRSQQEPPSQMSGSLESCGSTGAAVYDFKRYLPTGGLKHASSRVSLGSWSSGSDDSDTEWPSCSEASYEEVKSVRGSGRTSSHGNYRAAAVKPSPVVWCMCCNGDFVVTGCNDGAMEFWSITNGKLVCSFTDSEEGVTNVSFLSESFQLVVARLDGCLDFLQLGGPPGRTNLTPKAPESSPVNRSSPRAKRKNNPDLGHAPASAIVCHLIQRVRAHLKPVSLLRVLPGRVITGSQDRTLKVFRTDECVCVYTLYGHGDGITALFVDKTSPCTVVSGAANGGVRVWNIHSGECLSHLRGHVKAVTDVTCTAVHLVSVSLDNVMCIWDREHNTCLHRIVQFPGLCSNVIILSRHLFVTGGQGCIMLWDITSGRRVRTIPLGNDDASVFVRRVRLSGNATIVCDYGKELRVLTFPALLNKSE